MYDNTIKFVSQTRTVDAYGDTVATEREREVFAEVKSISQTEFYQADATGLKPEIKFVIADFLDYAGEKIVRFTPFGGIEETYTVLRTYRNNYELEIVCKRGIDT